MGGPTNEPRCPPTDRGSFFVDCAGQALGRKAKPQRDRTKLPERRLGELPVGVVRIEREDCAVGEGVKSCPRAGCGRSSGSLLPGSCFITSKTSPGESLDSARPERDVDSSRWLRPGWPCTQGRAETFGARAPV
jgi:hypothetical protein